MRSFRSPAILSVLVLALLAGSLSLRQASAGEPAARWSTTRTEGHESISLQLDLRASSPEGVLLTVGRVGFDSESVNIGLTMTNRSASPAGLNVHGDMRLRDDLGNEYKLQASRKARERLVGAGGQMIAEFAFLGPLHPDARSLTLEVNGGPEASAAAASAPRLSVGGIPVPPEARAAAEMLDVPAQATPVKTARHGTDESEGLWVQLPSGFEIGVRRIAFESDSIVVGVTARNPSSTAVELAGHDDLLLTDDLGNEYRAVLNKLDPKLVLGPGDSMDSELTFLGDLAPGARFFQLLVNGGASESGPETARQPRIVIRGIPAHAWKSPPRARTDQR